MGYSICDQQTGLGRTFAQITLLLFALMFTLPAASETFVGIKLGSMSVEGAQGSRPRNYALHLGYELDTLRLDTSIVGEINRTMDKGKTRGGESLEFESNGIYLMIKTNRRLFASLRVGYAENKIIAGSDTSREDGLALGGDVGVSIGRTRVRLQYTSYADDADYLSLSLDYWL